MKTIRFVNQLHEIERVRSFLRNFLEGQGLSDEAFYWIELALVEMCINTIRYAYPGDRGQITLKVWQKGKQLYFEIRDRGVPFDPSQAKRPDIWKMIDKERKGGLGIFLTRRLMDGFRYRHLQGENILRMRKTVHPR